MAATAIPRGPGIDMHKLSLFLFLLIYVITVSFCTYLFSPSMNPTMGISSDLNIKDPGSIGGVSPATGVGLISIVFGILTAMIQMMTFQVPLVPAYVQFVLAIPIYIFMFVLFDVIIDVINVILNIFNAVTKWL